MSEPRIIKRYTNRKLYDTRDSRYVTLTQIAGMVRAGEEITVVDNATKENLTSLTLAQIIYEQEKRSNEVLPLSALRELVRRSEAKLADIRDGLLVKPERPEGEEASASEVHDEGEEKRGIIDSSKVVFEDWQRRVDERLHTLLDTLAPFRQLQEEMRGVAERLEELEGRLRKLGSKRRADEEGAQKGQGGGEAEGEPRE